MLESPSFDKEADKRKIGIDGLYLNNINLFGSSLFNISTQRFPIVMKYYDSSLIKKRLSEIQIILEAFNDIIRRNFFGAGIQLLMFEVLRLSTKK